VLGGVRCLILSNFPFGPTRTTLVTLARRADDFGSEEMGSFKRAVGGGCDVGFQSFKWRTVSTSHSDVRPSQILALAIVDALEESFHQAKSATDGTAVFYLFLVFSASRVTGWGFRVCVCVD
jgi:hypothetical protein